MIKIKDQAIFKTLVGGDTSIKESRAEIVVEGLSAAYETDVRNKISALKLRLLEQRQSEDLGPDSSYSLLVAKDVKPSDFVDKAIKSRHETRKQAWMLEDSLASFEEHFSKEYLKEKGILRSDQVQDFIDGKVNELGNSLISEGKAVLG